VELAFLTCRSAVGVTGHGALAGIGRLEAGIDAAPYAEWGIVTYARISGR
jgi:hypothetical protein